MAYSQQQLQDLRAAIAEGTLRVSANGRSVEFRSLNEMLQLERLMADELEQTTRRPERIYVSHRRA